MKSAIKLAGCAVLLWAVAFSTAAAQRTRIVGTVVDSLSGNPLPGANIYFPGTNIGTTSDIQGKFYLTTPPLGKRTLRVDYIGYAPKRIPVNVLPGKTIRLDIKLTPAVVKGRAVVVTAQASAQVQEINQQLSAPTIRSVVSGPTIRELPESNAAEAVGRLPGVSLLREGGEGAKVVIRGLAPKYAKVQIDGVNIAPTAATDRSTDISMISPYMLQGIELTKSPTADQEADATGGIVNFRLREAPRGLLFNFAAEGGYNSLQRSWGNYKLTGGASDRFWQNRLGLYVQLNAERKYNSSDEMGGVWFYQENEGAPVETRSMALIDANRLVKRFGATLVADYTVPSTKVKLTSFTSQINHDDQFYHVTYDYFGNNFGRSLVDRHSNLFISVNALRLEQRLGNFTLGGRASYSYSRNKLPEELNLQVMWQDDRKPFGSPKSTYFQDLDPYTIPDSLKLPNGRMILGDLNHTEGLTEETERAFDLDLAYQKRLTNWLNFKVKMGARVKHKSKSNDQTVYVTHLSWGGPLMTPFRDLFVQEYWEYMSDINRRTLGDYTAVLDYKDFVDPNYRVEDFMGGRYVLDQMPNLEWIRHIDDLGMQKKVYLPNRVGSITNDYNGTEDYTAFYVMPQIQFGKTATFIPGVRYEKNRTEYTGYRIDGRSLATEWDSFFPDTVTTTRENEYVLPMMQLVVTPTPWLNVKLGYTKTLQRPNYIDLVPRWLLTRTYVSWNNFKLRPERATNLDLQLSLYTARTGLLSFGIFHKRIEDMIFWTGTRAIVDTSFFGLPSDMRFKKVAYAVNNENPATDYGFEVEWRTSFWYLPGFLKGFVLNLNYTRNFSEAKYLRTRIIQSFDEYFRVVLKNADTTYTNPLILQPAHLLNLTVGYDYKGFSIRWAFRYKSRIFTQDNWYEDLRGYSTPFYRYDVTLRQKLPFPGLELFAYFYNITNEFDRSVIQYKSFTSHEEHYGRFFSFGLRYRM